MVPSQMKMRLGMTTRVLRNVLITRSNLTATSGCVSRTGKLITTEFMSARFSQAPGLSFQLQVHGKETLLVALTPTSTSVVSPSQTRRARLRRILSLTPVIVGSITLSLE